MGGTYDRNPRMGQLARCYAYRVSLADYGAGMIAAILLLLCALIFSFMSWSFHYNFGKEVALGNKDDAGLHLALGFGLGFLSLVLAFYAGSQL